MALWLILGICICWILATVVFVIIMTAVHDNSVQNRFWGYPRHHLNLTGQLFLWFYVPFTIFWWSWVFTG